MPPIHEKEIIFSTTLMGQTYIFCIFTSQILLRIQE